MIDDLCEESPGFDLKTDLLAEVLNLGVIPKIGPDREIADRLIQQLGDLNESQPMDEETGLTAFLVSDLLWQLSDLESSLRERVGLVSQQAVKAHPLTIGRFAQAETALLLTLEEFCHQAALPTTYFQLNLFDHPKAREILAYICRQTAARYQQEYPKWIFEPYQHPQKEIPGIWMSQIGRHYDEPALLKMEKPRLRKILNRTPFIQ